jgi:hypothetical protein
MGVVGSDIMQRYEWERCVTHRKITNHCAGRMVSPSCSSKLRYCETYWSYSDQE